MKVYIQCNRRQHLAAKVSEYTFKKFNLDTEIILIEECDFFKKLKNQKEAASSLAQSSTKSTAPSAKDDFSLFLSFFKICNCFSLVQAWKPGRAAAPAWF